MRNSSSDMISRFSIPTVVLFSLLSILVPAVVSASGYPEFRQYTSSLVFASDNQSVALAYSHCAPIRIVNLSSGAIDRILSVDGPVVDMAFSHNGRYLAAGVFYSLEPLYASVLLWDVSTGEMIGRTRARTVRFVAFSDDDSLIYFENYGKIVSWDYLSDTIQETSLSSLIFSHSLSLCDSSVAVNVPRGLSARTDRESGAGVIVESTGSGDVITHLHVTQKIRSLFFAPSGEQLAAIISGETSKVLFWDTDTWDAHKAIVLAHEIIEGAFGRDGELIAFHTSDHSLIVLDTQSETEVLNAQVKLPEEDLYEASSQGDLDRVLEILQTKPDIEMAIGKNFPTALMTAVYKGHSDVVQVLIQGGADVNGRPWHMGRTPLSTAIHSNVPEIARILIDAGAETDTLFERNQTYLMKAAEKGETDIIALLLQDGVDLNKQSDSQYTALMHAIVFGNKESVLQLLQSGADTSLRTWQNKSALDLAMERRDTAISMNWDSSVIADIEGMIEALKEYTGP